MYYQDDFSFSSLFAFAMPEMLKYFSVQIKEDYPVKIFTLPKYTRLHLMHIPETSRRG